MGLRSYVPLENFLRQATVIYERAFGYFVIRKWLSVAADY